MKNIKINLIQKKKIFKNVFWLKLLNIKTKLMKNTRKNLKKKGLIIKFNRIKSLKNSLQKSLILNLKMRIYKKKLINLACQQKIIRLNKKLLPNKKKLLIHFKMM